MTRFKSKTQIQHGVRLGSSLLPEHAKIYKIPSSYTAAPHNSTQPRAGPPSACAVIQKELQSCEKPLPTPFSKKPTFLPYVVSPAAAS